MNLKQTFQGKSKYIETLTKVPSTTKNVTAAGLYLLVALSPAVIALVLCTAEA